MQVVATYTYLDAKVVDNFISIGDRLVGAAQHSASVWNKFGFGPWSLPAWSAGVSVVAATNREAQLPNIPIKLGGYTRIDAGVFYDARLMTRDATASPCCASR